VAALGAWALAGCAPGRLATAGSGQVRSADEPTLTAEAKARVQAHAHYATAVSLQAREQETAALEEFGLAALADPGDEELVLEVTARLLQHKQPERALQILTNALRQPHVSGALHARLGFVHAELGQIERAIQANRAAIRQSPSLLAGYHNLYLNYLQTRQHDLALQTLDAAAQVPGTGPDFLLGLAELYANFAVQVPAQRAHAQARALALLRRADQVAPPSPQYRLKLADGFSLLGDTERAAALYLAALQDIQDQPLLREAVRARLTDFYLRSRDRARAREQLEAILRDNPTNPQAHYVLGCLAFEERRMEEAADHFERTIHLSPGLVPAYYDLASAQLNLDRPAEALATLAQARNRFPQTFALEYLTALARVRLRDYAGAIRHFTAAEVVARVTETNRLTHTFYFEFGAALERNGDFEAAVQTLEKSLALAPQFPEAQNYLGYMWAERGTNLDRAHALIRQAVEAQPNNAAYLDSLAWVLFKLGKPQEALDAMLRALQADRQPDPTLYDHLGDIYAALGQWPQAREAWRKALELAPSETLRKKLESPAPQ